MTETAQEPAPLMKVLAVDVGGTHVKILASGETESRKVPSGATMTAAEMVKAVLALAEGWTYDAVAIGYPGPVRRNRPTEEPVNLGPGWVDFDYAAAFGKPVRLVNDAAMQALGSYEGGTMLFLGLGTGLGAALIVEGTLVPLELAHLPYKKGLTYEEYVGERALERFGKKKWREEVSEITGLLKVAMQAEYVVLGGGNVRLFKELPPDCRQGANEHAFAGGFRLWGAAG